MAVKRPAAPVLTVVDESGEVAAPITAALACAMLPPRWRVVCRSLAPAAGGVHPLALQVMGEWGLEPEPWPPTSLAPEDLDGASTVIVLTRVLPPALLPPRAELLSWTNCWPPREDSASEQDVNAVRSLRDQIRRRLEEWAVDQRL